LLAVTRHTMKLQMAGETDWELQRRMSDSEKLGASHCTSCMLFHLYVCIVAQYKSGLLL